MSEVLTNKDSVIRTMNLGTDPRVQKYGAGLTSFQMDEVSRGQDVSFGESFGASLRRESFLDIKGVSALAQKGINFLYSGDEFIDPDLNVYDEIKGTKYEAFEDEFLYTSNRESLKKQMKSIDQFLVDADLQARGGFGAVLGSLAGGVANPTNFMIGAGLIGKGGAIAKILGTSGAAGGTVLLQEQLGQFYDVTKTDEEQVSNAIVATLFGGLLGSFSAAGYKANLSTKQTKDMSKVFDDTIEEFLPEQALKEVNTVKKREPLVVKKGDDAFDLLETNSAFNVTVAATKWLNPGLRILTDVTSSLKEIGSNLFSHNLRVKGKFKPISAEAEITARAAEVHRPLMEGDNLFKMYKKRDGKLNRKEFNEELRLSIELDRVSNISEVNTFKKSIMEWTHRVAVRGEKNGIFEEGFASSKFGKKFYPRNYEIAKVESNLTDFRTKLAEDFIEKEPRLAKDPDSIKSMVNQVVKNISDPNIPTHLKTRVNIKGGGGAQSLKARTLNLSPERFKEYISTDLEHTLTSYARSVETDFVFVERFGDVDMTAQFKAVGDEYDDLISKATDNKAIKKLIDNKEKALIDLAAVRDVIRGTYDVAKPGTFMRTLTSVFTGLNFLAFMGLGAISQLPDLARMTAVVRLSKSKYLNSVMGDAKTAFDDIQLTKTELADMELALDTHLNSRAASYGDVDDLKNSSNMLERGIGKVVGMFSNFNLMSPMNDVTRGFTANHVVRNIIEDADLWKHGTLGKEGIDEMLKNGIDKNLRNKILSQVKKHSSVDDGVVTLNLDKWDEITGIELRSIARSYVDNVVFLPGAADKPLWMRGKGVGKIVGQFRSFTSAAYMRGLLPSLQEISGVGGKATMRASSRIFNGIVLGGLASMLREKVKGRDLDGWSVEKFIVEGFDRGGAFPLIMDVNNVFDRFNLGLATALGTQKVNRFRDASLLGVVFGASAGLIDDTTPAVARMIRGEGTDADSRKLMRRAPGYNLLYWNWLSDQLGR